MADGNVIEGIPENELWKRYRSTGDMSLRDAIVKQYAPLVKYVAGKVSVGMPQNVDFDDLVGFGVFGLFDAIEKFDPEKHQAISMIEAPDTESNCVVEVMQKGFLLNDRLIRPAMVVVSKKP